jgi:hypothetical protein
MKSRSRSPESFRRQNGIVLLEPLRFDKIYEQLRRSTMLQAGVINDAR